MKSGFHGLVPVSGPAVSRLKEQASRASRDLRPIERLRADAFGFRREIHNPARPDPAIQRYFLQPFSIANEVPGSVHMRAVVKPAMKEADVCRIALGVCPAGPEKFGFLVAGEDGGPLVGGNANVDVSAHKYKDV